MARGPSPAGLKASISGISPVERTSYVEAKEPTEVTRELERHLSVHLDRRVASGSVKPVKVRNTAKVLGARTLARLFKKELVFIASDEPILYGDGFALGDTIFVWSDAEAPLFVLLGHELTHHLRAHDEISFRRLQAAVLASISKEDYKTEA